ncbi:hypothetical protein C8J57DRAFT_311754 [Mycena rebaudengoi]|nr:hypothetical protein C8J57DRAFT_311754 [Mycena rebaudengoi]
MSAVASLRPQRPSASTSRTMSRMTRMRTMSMAYRHRGCHRRVIPPRLEHTGDVQPRSLGSRPPPRLVGRHTPVDTMHTYIPRSQSLATMHPRGRAEDVHARTARPDEHGRRATAASSRTARTHPSRRVGSCWAMTCFSSATFVLRATLRQEAARRFVPSAPGGAQEHLHTASPEVPGLRARPIWEGVFGA